MDSISKADAPTAVHQDWQRSDGQKAGKDLEVVVPIEEEALEGAHIDLSWRSWVGLSKQHI